MRQLSSRERERIYICLSECPGCGAHRGERCYNNAKPGQRMRSGYHYQRGQVVQRMRRNPALVARYNKLRQQIFNEGEIPGHE